MPIKNEKSEISASLFIILLIVSLAENILIPITTLGVIATLLGIILVPVLWRANFGSDMQWDLSATPQNFFMSFGYGLLMAILAAGLTIGVEEVGFLLLGNKGFFLQSHGLFRYMAKETSLLYWIQRFPIVLRIFPGCVVALLTGVSSELVFRCFLLNSSIASGRTALQSNFRQAILYTIFTTVYIDYLIVRMYIFHGTGKSILWGLFLIAISTIAAFLFGFAQGLLRLSFESVWGCILVGIVFDLFSSSVLTHQYLPNDLHRSAGLLRSCGFCLFAFLASLPWLRRVRQMD